VGDRRRADVKAAGEERRTRLPCEAEDVLGRLDAILVGLVCCGGVRRVARRTGRCGGSSRHGALLLETQDWWGDDPAVPATARSTCCGGRERSEVAAALLELRGLPDRAAVGRYPVADPVDHVEQGDPRVAEGL